MSLSTLRTSAIGYKKDYDSREEPARKKTYRINGNGVRHYFMVAIADGNSIEFLMTECFGRFDEIRAAIAPPGWSGVICFRELLLCLEGDAKSECIDLIAREYPEDQDKNGPDTFMNLRRDLITRLADYTYPGDRVHTYLLTKVKYQRCKKEDGRLEEPTKYLSRLLRIRYLGSLMHHNQGATFMTDTDFKFFFWHSFPDTMKEWLTDEQDRDPFDTQEPMDIQEIADAMQRYWNRNSKRVKAQQDREGKNNKKRDRDDDG